MNKKIITALVCLVSLSLLGACGNDNDGNQRVTSSVASSESLTVSSHPTSTSLKNTEFKISLDEAIAAFTDKHPNTAITKIELGTDFGQYKYKIKGIDETNEYELKVDATTKEISKEEQEPLDKDERNGVAKKEEGLDLTNVISPKKAIESAGTVANNKKITGNVTEWTLEKDNQRIVYGVKFEDGQNDTELKIDGINGKLIEVD